MAYCTTLQIADFVKIRNRIPALDGGKTERVPETILTNNTAETEFFLEHGLVIDNSYAFNYGSANNSTAYLTETDDFSIDLDLGKGTLTAAGLAKMSGTNLYGSYSYTDSISDSEIVASIANAEQEIDNRTYTHFFDGTAETPDYSVNTNIKFFNDTQQNHNIWIDPYPLQIPTAALTLTAPAATSRLELDDVTGLPASGYIQIESEKIQYSAKDTDTNVLTLSGTTSDEHTIGSEITTFILERIQTGDETTYWENNLIDNDDWEVIRKDVDYSYDKETGLINIDVNYDYLRATFLSGVDEIPSDICHACKMIAAKDIQHQVVRAAHVAGNNDFKPEVINVDEDWINRKIQENARIKVSKI